MTDSLRCGMSLPAWGEWIEIFGAKGLTLMPWSLPAWGEWIEICIPRGCGTGSHGLSPHGESGLKSPLKVKHSIPRRLSPHGESGLKYKCFVVDCFCRRLSPHGESGLKSAPSILLTSCNMSLPAWGEWIEILCWGQMTCQ